MYRIDYAMRISMQMKVCAVLVTGHLWNEQDEVDRNM